LQAFLDLLANVDLDCRSRELNLLNLFVDFDGFDKVLACVVMHLVVRHD
jgi:hypothetical protein